MSWRWRGCGQPWCVSESPSSLPWPVASFLPDQCDFRPGMTCRSEVSWCSSSGRSPTGTSLTLVQKLRPCTQEGELKVTGLGGVSIWRQDNSQVRRRAITYPLPRPPTLLLLSCVLSSLQGLEKTEGRGGRGLAWRWGWHIFLRIR